MEDRLDGRSPFLWVDEGPDRSRRARQGEILASPGGTNSPEQVPYGLIHDWVGAVFIPNATIGDVVPIPEMYRPVVIDAKLLDCAGKHRKFSMVLMRKVLFVTAAVDGDFEMQDIELDKRRWYGVSYSTRVQEIQNFGQADERSLPPDQGSGYLWRMYGFTRFEERDGGVYAGVEAIGLTRDIPLGVRWLAKPVVEPLPRNSVVTSLQDTRDATRSAIEGKLRIQNEPTKSASNCNPTIVSRPQNARAKESPLALIAR